MSVLGADEQLRIEQQKTDKGVVSSVNGWMSNGLPTGVQKPKYNKAGKLVLDEQEVVCEDGRMVLDRCLQDEVVEVEDLGHLLIKNKPKKVQKKIEEPAVKQEEEFKPKGGGMKIIIKGPFKVKHTAPSFIKEKKTVQEAPPVKQVVEEAEDSGVETTPTHQRKKHKLTFQSYEQEETLKWAMGSLRMPPYDIASWHYPDPELHRATESVTRSEEAPKAPVTKVSKAEEKVVRAPLEEVQGAAPNTAYSKPSYDAVKQDGYKALTHTVPSMQAVKLDTAEEKEVKTSLDEVQGLVPKIVQSTPCYDTVRQDGYKALTHTVPSLQAVKLDTAEEKEVKTSLDEVQGLVPKIVNSTPCYDTVRQDGYKALTNMVPSLQAVKLDTAEEKEVKTSLDEVQGLVPKIVQSTPCYHTVRQDRYKAFTLLVASEKAPSLKQGKEQKAHLRLVMKGGDLAPINWHKAAVAAVTQEYVRAKYSQISSNNPIHFAEIQSAILDIGSIETQVDIDLVKPELIPVGTHFYKTKLRFAKSEDPVYTGILESVITVPQSVDDLAPIQKEKANVVDVNHKYLKAKSNVVASTTAQQYLQGNQKSLHLAEDEVDGIIEPFRARGSKLETIPQPYNEAVKYAITLSQQGAYHQAKSHDLILKTEVTKEDTGRVEFEKAAVEHTGQKLSSHDTAITKAKWRYFGVKEGQMTIKPESVKEDTGRVEFHKAAVEHTGQKLLSHDTAITESGQPTYHQAKKNHLILTTEVVKEDKDRVEFQKPTEELTEQKLFGHDTSITKSGQPTYHQAKNNHSILTTEVVKEDKDRVEFQKPTEELTEQKLFGHDTSITKSGQPTYYQAKNNDLILTTEVVKEDKDCVEFQKPTEELTEQKLFGHDTSITKSGQPTYHQAKNNHLILTPEAVKEDTGRVEFHKAAVELTGQKLFRHNTAITKSKWRYFGVREGRMTLKTEGVLGLDTPLNYETAIVRKVEQELHTANKEEVLVEEADYLSTKPRRVAAPPLETLGVVEPLEYQAVCVGSVDAVYAKADQGKVTVQDPKYNTAVTNSAFLTVSDTEEDVPEIKYETSPLQTIPVEPLHNVIVGEGKSECNLLQAEESVLDELPLEKTRKLKPPVIESAVREIVHQPEMTRPVFITNQAAVHAPLPTFTANEQNSLPEWETCQTLTVEEVTPLRAKPSVVLMNVCRAKASQPKVQVAEEVGVVQVDAVDCASPPPPKTRPGVFYVKPKEVLQHPIEEVESIDNLETESAKVNEVETPTLHKVKVTPVTKYKLELPKLEIREEIETITVEDLDLSPVTIVSPKKKQIHAKIQLEEPTNVESQMQVSLQALPRPLLKQANEDILNEVPLGSTLEIPEVAYHKARTSLCPLLTSHRAGAIKLPVQRAPPGFNKDWRTLKKLEGQRASLMVNGETEAPYFSRTSSVHSLSSQLSNDMWTYADDRKPTEKAEIIEPSPAASPEKLSSPTKPGSRKPLDADTFKAPEETDAPAPIKEEPKATPPKKGSAIQMVRELLGLPTKGKPQPETKPDAAVVNETPPEPVLKETPAPVVNKSPKPAVKETPPEPVVKEMPAPVVNKAPEPVVKETPAPVVNKSPEPVVKETPPEPVVKETLAPVVSKAPEPVVKETAPEPVVKETPAPVLNKVPEPVIETPPEPVVKETPAPVVNKAPEPVVKETPPEPVIKETPPEPVVKVTPAPAVSKAPEPIVIDEAPPREPDYNVPTTPIPSSMVVPPGPQKSPPAAAASSPTEKLGFWDSLMRREPNKPAAAAAPEDSSTKPNISDKDTEADGSDADAPEDEKSNWRSKVGLSRYLGIFKRDSERGKEEKTEEKKDEKSPKRLSLLNRAPMGSSEPQ
ncbi:titin-like [Branchiostoma floridae]|uniref:Titin-like n=1 Tax=Branchiostoma floridae TaxID=7739 RepID=A0A9J7N348_BRAFL|nr:titin-like [Branchiostoma floridae]